MHDIEHPDGVRKHQLRDPCAVGHQRICRSDVRSVVAPLPDQYRSRANPEFPPNFGGKGSETHKAAVTGATGAIASRQKGPGNGAFRFPGRRALASPRISAFAFADRPRVMIRS